jgi:hypothetical protein
MTLRQRIEGVRFLVTESNVDLPWLLGGDGERSPMVAKLTTIHHYRRRTSWRIVLLRDGKRYWRDLRLPTEEVARNKYRKFLVELKRTGRMNGYWRDDPEPIEHNNAA